MPVQTEHRILNNSFFPPFECLNLFIFFFFKMTMSDVTITESVLKAEWSIIEK